MIKAKKPVLFWYKEEIVKYFFALIFILFFTPYLSGQNINYAISIVDTLSAPGMHGRGYVNEGDKIAANFISNEFEKYGLRSFENRYFQHFTININTFPDTLKVTVDNNKLVPGKEFVVFSSSPQVSGTFDLEWCLSDSTGNPLLKDDIDLNNLADKVIVTDINQNKFKEIEYFNSVGIIFLMDEKVWWHVSNGRTINDFFAMQIVKNEIPVYSKTISVNIKNSYLKDYQTQNVVGYVKGEKYPEKFFVFTAHYDHLGKMGAETWFPGSNDNASGTAMLLDLASYYSQPNNQPDISIVFIAFSAEEVGLLGSGYYAENPLFPLEKIEFLINLDMVGSGSEGIKVVNGSVFENEFKKLVKINSENEYLIDVSKRDEAANSDHYPFYTKGVPCFFIYTLGKECNEYHNIFDTPDNIPFTEYEDLFRLLNDFVKTF